MKSKKKPRGILALLDSEEIRAKNTKGIKFQGLSGAFRGFQGLSGVFSGAAFKGMTISGDWQKIEETKTFFPTVTWCENK